MFLDIAIVGATLVILYLAGWGLTRFLLGDELEAWTWCVAPWSGIAVIILVTSLLGLFGIGTKYSGPACLLIGLALLFAARRKLSPYSAWTQIKMNKWVLVPSFVLLFSGLLPVVWLTDVPTAVSYGNNDPFGYAVVADYLHDRGLVPPPPVDPEVPYFSHPWKLLKAIPRWGANLLLSAVDSVLWLKGYQGFNFILLAVASCVPVAIFFFSKVMLEQSDRVALLAALFFALNVNVLWVLYHGFLAQVVATGLLTTGLTLGVRTLERGISWPTLLGAILGSAMIGTYPEMAFFLGAPLVLYTLILFIRRSDQVFHVGLRAGSVGLMTLAVFPSFSINAWHALEVYFAGMRTGWDLPRYASLPEAIGLWNLHPLPKLSTWITLALSLVLLTLLLRGILLSKRRVLYLVVIASYVPILIYTRFISPYSYGYYKGITFCLFAAAALLAGSFETRDRQKKWETAVLRITCLCVVGMLVFASYGLTNDYIRANHIIVDSNLIQLSQLGHGQTPIYLLQEPWWHQLWAIYFLGPRKVTLSAGNGYVEPFSVREYSKADEIVVATTGSGDIVKFEPPPSEIYLKNEMYVVGKFSVNLSWLFGSGWWGVERHISRVTFRWISQDALLTVHAAEDAKLRLQMETFSYGMERQLQIFLNEELVGEYLVTGHVPEHRQLLETEPFAFRAGPNTIRFHAVEGPVPAGGNDPRELGLGFASIEFVPAKTL